MTETLLALVPQYGVALVFLATFLSCLALPVPSSLIMLTGGAFAASGDLSLTQIVASAFIGATLGDQVGFSVGKHGGKHIERLANGNPKRAALLERARQFSKKYGGLGVFLSRWLASPLGPYVNFLSGAASMKRLRFTLWDIAGEMVWVSLYVGLGYAFSTQLEAVGQILGNLSGTIAAGLVTLWLGWFLFNRSKTDRNQVTEPPS